MLALKSTLLKKFMKRKKNSRKFDFSYHRHPCLSMIFFSSVLQVVAMLKCTNIPTQFKASVNRILYIFNSLAEQQSSFLSYESQQI